MKPLESSSSLLRRISTPLSHLLFIVIIFVLPELVMTIAMPHRRGPGIFPGIYVKTLIYIAAFYLNYFLIIDRTLGKNRRNGVLRFLGYNLVIIIAGLVLCYIISKIWFPGKGGRHAADTITVILKSASWLMRDAVMIILTIGLSVALRLSAKWQDIDRAREEAVAAQRATELANLKSQLNPHFLFNTLNTIYALVDICPDDAKDAVHRLSGLLRYMLYDDVKAVTLRKEADFIVNYVLLMKMRLQGNPVNVDIDLDDHAQAEVPPLLFIPLVENAFKYGTADKDPVSISMKVVGSELVCTTENSFARAGDDNSGDMPQSSGIGQANLRRRLQLIYGTSASLTIHTDANIYRTRLVVPLEISDRQ